MNAAPRDRRDQRGGGDRDERVRDEDREKERGEEEERAPPVRPVIGHDRACSEDDEGRRGERDHHVVRGGEACDSHEGGRRVRALAEPDAEEEEPGEEQIVQREDLGVERPEEERPRQPQPAPRGERPHAAPRDRERGVAAVIRHGRRRGTPRSSRFTRQATGWTGTRRRRDRSR